MPATRPADARTFVKPDAAAALRNAPVFRTADEAVIAKLLERCQTLSCPKGHVLFMQGDLAEWFYIIDSGWVKLFRETLDGDEVVMDVMPRGHIFGETAAFEDGTYSCSAEIVEPAVLLAYPLSVLDLAVRNNGALALAMLRHVSGRSLMQGKEIEHRTAQNAPQRLGCYLLRLCDPEKTGPAVIHLPHDKVMIAARLGMQPETFSRALARLQKDVGLRVRGATVEIGDIGLLTSYTCSACSNAFPCEK